MQYNNPKPTVDVVVHRQNLEKTEILLIERVNPPYGWALPGGFVDAGERVEAAAIREVQEETSLTISLDHLLYVYSDPKRDLRQHTLSVVFTAELKDDSKPIAQDDAKQAKFFTLDNIPTVVFDHHEIINDFINFQKTLRIPDPHQKLVDAKS